MDEVPGWGQIMAWARGLNDGLGRIVGRNSF